MIELNNMKQISVKIETCTPLWIAAQTKPINIDFNKSTIIFRINNYEEVIIRYFVYYKISIIRDFNKSTITFRINNYQEIIREPFEVILNKDTAWIDALSCINYGVWGDLLDNRCNIFLWEIKFFIPDISSDVQYLNYDNLF